MFIVVGDDGKSYKEHGTYSYANTGLLLYQVGAILPIIRKGSGCMGLGVVLGYSTTGNTTTVSFKAMGKVPKEDRDAYFRLYRMNAGVSSDESDPYDSTDAFIPGAMGLGRKAYSTGKKPIASRSTYDNFNDFFED